jgi:hypothetical protein
LTSKMPADGASSQRQPGSRQAAGAGSVSRARP